MTTKTILETLEDYDGDRGRIVSFELSMDKTKVTIEECCDYYFRTVLTKGEFGQFPSHDPRP